LKTKVEAPEQPASRIFVGGLKPRIIQPETAKVGKDPKINRKIVSITLCLKDGIGIVKALSKILGFKDELGFTAEEKAIVGMLSAVPDGDALLNDNLARVS
jgi:hypothetical protein